MYCPKCGKEIPDDFIHCPQCGRSLVASPRTVFIQQKENSGCGKKIAYGFLVLFGIGMLGAIAESANKSNSAKANSTATVSADAATKEKPADVDSVTKGNSPDANSTATEPADTENNESQAEAQSEETTGKQADAADAGQTPVPPPIPASFTSDCGIEATAHLASHQYINHPQLSISVRNVSKKGIAAIQFYAIPYDVYGEDISSSIFSQKRLQTDDLIPAGKKEVLNYGPFLNQSMKSVKLYVYSIYFEDGSEWGDHEATRQEILKYGKLIEATFQK